jgi:hypothetical protein
MVFTAKVSKRLQWNLKTKIMMFSVWQHFQNSLMRLTIKGIQERIAHQEDKSSVLHTS